MLEFKTVKFAVFMIGHIASSLISQTYCLHKEPYNRTKHNGIVSVPNYCHEAVPRNDNRISSTARTGVAFYVWNRISSCDKKILSHIPKAKAIFYTENRSRPYARNTLVLASKSGTGPAIYQD